MEDLFYNIANFENHGSSSFPSIQLVLNGDFKQLLGERTSSRVFFMSLDELILLGYAREW